MTSSRRRQDVEFFDGCVCVCVCVNNVPKLKWQMKEIALLHRVNNFSDLTSIYVFMYFFFSAVICYLCKQSHFCRYDPSCNPMKYGHMWQRTNQLLMNGVPSANGPGFFTSISRVMGVLHLSRLSEGVFNYRVHIQTHTKTSFRFTWQIHWPLSSKQTNPW